MNAFELSTRLLDFYAVLREGAISNDDKQIIFNEMLRSLPPALLCATAPGTRELVEAKIRKQLDAPAEVASQEAPKDDVQLADGQQQLLRSTSTDAGRQSSNPGMAKYGKGGQTNRRS